jgi:hypothetical protein
MGGEIQRGSFTHDTSYSTKAHCTGKPFTYAVKHVNIPDLYDGGGVEVFRALTVFWILLLVVFLFYFGAFFDYVIF